SIRARIATAARKTAGRKSASTSGSLETEPFGQRPRYAEIVDADRRIVTVSARVRKNFSRARRVLFQDDVTSERRAFAPTVTLSWFVIVFVDGRSKALARDFVHVAKSGVVGVPRGL